MPPTAAPAAPKGTASAGIVMTGHARDPEITRWRPFVKLTKTQSGMSTLQEQAEWQVRVLRGEGDLLLLRVVSRAKMQVIGDEQHQRHDGRGKVNVLFLHVKAGVVT